MLSNLIIKHCYTIKLTYSKCKHMLMSAIRAKINTIFKNKTKLTVFYYSLFMSSPETNTEYHCFYLCSSKEFLSVSRNK